MWKNHKNLKRVETWYNTHTERDTRDALEEVFHTGTSTGSPISLFFQDIWIPLAKRKGGNGSDKHDIIPGEYKYVNVGFTTAEMTDIYWVQYRSLFLSEPLDTTSLSTVALSTAHLSKIIKAILIKNRYKYLKWIDEMGYAYNPLWNVDGTELYQSLDNHGEVKRLDSPILQTSIKGQTNSYDGTLKDTTKETFGYNNTTEETVSGLTSVNEEQHEHAKNLVNGEEVDYTVSADDAAFGTALTGGDYMHVEKRLRQGNIGVTKSTELIESEREMVRFNLLQEFFNDINKEILIGIYI